MKKMSKFVCAALALAFAATAHAEAMPVPRDGYVLQAQVQGSGPVAVVFESGFGQGPEAWDGVIAELGADWRTIAYSRAGIGDSTLGKGATDIDAHVQDLAAVIDALAPETDVVLVGHSYGGLLATEFLRRYPQRLRGLVLVDPSTLGQRHAQRAVDAERIAADDAMLLERLPPNLYADYAALVAQLDLPTSVTPNVLPDVPVALLTATNIAADPFVFEETAAGKVVWKREHAALFAAVVRGSHRYVATSHNLQGEQPKVVAEAIREVAGSAPTP